MSTHDSPVIHVKHVFKVAWILACLLTIAKHHALLDWLDLATLQMAFTALSEERLNPNPLEISNMAGRPLVATISDTLYETEFGQGSPLDRGKLAGFIRQLVLSRAPVQASIPRGPDPCSRSRLQLPRSLVIDLDLSPTAGQDEAASVNGSELDALLHEIASCIPVILATPIEVTTSAAVKLKAEWMQRLCSAGHQGIHFAYTDIFVEQNYVTRYRKSASSLGGLAKQVESLEVATARTFNKGTARVDGLRQLPCQRVKQDDYRFLSRLSPEVAIPAKSLSPLNWQAFRDIELPWRARSLTLEEYSEELDGGHVSGRTVFIGGDYSQTDQYNTPLGPLHGIHVHTVEYLTQKETANVKTIIKTSSALVFILDIIVGMLFGLVFHYTWGKVTHRDKPTVWPTWSIVHYCVLFAGLATVVWISAVFLVRFSIWLQPAPLVLGPLIDAHLTQIPGYQQKTPAVERWHNWRTLLSGLFILLITSLAFFYMGKDLLESMQQYFDR